MRNNIQVALGKQIQKLRRNANLSQEQFAEEIGIAINTLSNIERGNAFMTSQTMENIVKILKIDPHELFNFHDWNGSEEDTYKFIIKKINSIKNNKHKLDMLEKFIKFVL